MELLRIFVSATLDLEQERSAVGRALAELPVKVGAEIRRTPPEGTKYDDLYEAIANVDRVYFLLGKDITAPAGAEWDLAWKLERRLLPLRTAGPRSPAGRKFMRFLPTGWITFQSYAELTRVISLDLISLLLHPQNRYGLTMLEQDQLQRLYRRLEQQSPLGTRHQGSGLERSGVEGGGVLLDDGRRDLFGAEDRLIGQ